MQDFLQKENRCFRWIDGMIPFLGFLRSRNERHVCKKPYLVWLEVSGFEAVWTFHDFSRNSGECYVISSDELIVLQS